MNVFAWGSNAKRDACQNSTRKSTKEGRFVMEGEKLENPLETSLAEAPYPWFYGEQDVGTCCSAKKSQIGQLQSSWIGEAVLYEAIPFPSNQSPGSLH